MYLHLTYRGDHSGLAPDEIEVLTSSSTPVPVPGDIITIKDRDYQVLARKYRRESSGRLELTGLVLS